MNKLDKFGKFFVDNFRDKAFYNLQNICNCQWKAPDLQDLQNKIADLSDDKKLLVCELVDDILTSPMHDLLFAFHESHDFDEGIDIIVDDESVAGLSDGLHGEIFGEDVWMVRFSKYPAEKEIEGSKEAAKFINEILKNKDGENG